MQKISTPLNKTDFKPDAEKIADAESMQPSEDSLKKILQFASNYRVQKINKNQFIEMILN